MIGVIMLRTFGDQAVTWWVLVTTLTVMMWLSSVTNQEFSGSACGGFSWVDWCFSLLRRRSRVLFLIFQKEYGCKKMHVWCSRHIVVRLLCPERNRLSSFLYASWLILGIEKKWKEYRVFTWKVRTYDSWSQILHNLLSFYISLFVFV
jgi:hypothetical protein